MFFVTGLSFFIFEPDFTLSFFLFDEVSSKNTEVKNAAIIAMAQIGGQNVASKLLDILKKGNDESTTSVKQALLLVNDPGLIKMIIAKVPQFEGSKKAIFNGI